MTSDGIGGAVKFDPRAFTVTPPRTFADLTVGEVLRNPSRIVGDTLYAELAITALIPQRTTGIVVMAATIHDQNGELVLTGEHKYLLRK